MPGLIRKVAIIAAIDGLILQPHGLLAKQNDIPLPQALHVEYKSCKISTRKALSPKSYRSSTFLESHGVIGLLNVASYSYLISINRREQVAQIFGKPIYVITDVSLLPLQSEADAEKEISAVNASNSNQQGFDSQSDTDASEDESDTDLTSHRSVVSEEDVSTPNERDQQLGTQNSWEISKEKDSSSLSTHQYGHFAASWLSKRGWAFSPNGIHGGALQSREIPATSHPVEDLATPSSRNQYDSDDIKKNSGSVILLPKLLRTTRMLLSAKNFFYSYDYNITARFGHSDKKFLKEPLGEALETTFFWNNHLAGSMLTKDAENYVIPIMQGFVGQKAFVAKQSPSNSRQTTAVESLERLLLKDEKRGSSSSDGEQSFLLTVISRRSTGRAGLRYTRRGVDDNGDVANCCETEQILSSPTWDFSVNPRAFLQLRGSIPLYFSQSPYSFKPHPILHHSESVNEKAFSEHFRKLTQRYGQIQVACLVDKHGTEARIGENFESHAEHLRSSSEKFHDGLHFDWFDFHGECRGMKFENVLRLVNKMAPRLSDFGENVISISDAKDPTSVSHQEGIFRVNCMDCLDRTNVVQSAFGQYMLEHALRSEGFNIDFQQDSSTQWFNNLWADNGDAVSRQYASTAALKGDFTRTRRRNYRGMMNDFGLTLSRYYSNTVNDYFSQTVIDVLLGNASDVALDDFEANMMNADPGISIEKIRQHAIQTCEKIVIQDSDEQSKNGWILLSPSQPSTLRALPMEEVVILLTETALYSCRFDWSTEKIASFERIDLGSINKIMYGTYITSTLTEKQKDEKSNVGLVISYRKGKETISRVNTRSLQNEKETSGRAMSASGKETFGISWLTGRDSSASAQMMALKASPVGSTNAPVGEVNAEMFIRSICQEIQRAKLVDCDATLDEKDPLVEKADIISLSEAIKRTGYLEHLGHQVKRFVWA